LQMDAVACLSVATRRSARESGEKLARRHATCKLKRCERDGDRVPSRVGMIPMTGHSKHSSHAVDRVTQEP